MQPSVGPQATFLEKAQHQVKINTGNRVFLFYSSFLSCVSYRDEEYNLGVSNDTYEGMEVIIHSNRKLLCV
jgi:hypothetical protein